MKFRVVHWVNLHNSLAFYSVVLEYWSSMQGEDIFSVVMASAMCLHFSMQEEDILEHANGKCHLCTLSSTCRPLCNIDMPPHKTTLNMVFSVTYCLELHVPIFFLLVMCFLTK